MAIPTMSLKVQQFTPAGFTANNYVYNPIDYTALERSMAAKEVRKEKAVTQHMNVNNILGQIEPQLHQDEATKQWFANYKKYLNDTINLDIEAGDYGEAFRTATRLAGDVANDSALQGRVKANADYNKYVEGLDKRVRSKEISETTRKRALKENEYYYNDISDDFGNVIGGTTFEGKEPVNDINWAEHTVKAASLIRPDVTQKSGLTGGQKTTTPGELNTTGWGWSLEQVDFNEIYRNANTLLGAESDGFKKLVQSWENDKFILKELENELEQLDPFSEEYKSKKQQVDKFTKLLSSDNGSTLTDLNEYYARKVWDYANSLAYKKYTRDDKNVMDYQTGGKGDYPSVNPSDELDQANPNIVGAHTRQNAGGNTAVVDMAANRTSNRFVEAGKKQIKQTTGVN